MGEILFYDPVCPAPYASRSLLEPSARIGGTEATVVRVAEQLSLSHRVTVAQKTRRDREQTAGRDLSWVPAKEAFERSPRPDAIVVLRWIGDLPKLRFRYPRTPMFVWYHDWFDEAPKGPGAKAWLSWQAKIEARVLLHSYARAVAVGVSKTHEENLRRALAHARALRFRSGSIGVRHVHNPIAEDLGPSEDTSYDPSKLIFFSAPWKGLDQVLVAFAEVRKRLPELELHVASPGYGYDAGRAGGPSTENVVFLGSLTHADVLREVRSSLCVFYPADQIPETFGLVFAEANAVGTPVLTHPFGAAPELLTPEQLVDAHDTDAIVARLRAWREGGRPVVRAMEKLRLPAIARSWEELLFSPR